MENSDRYTTRPKLMPDRTTRMVRVRCCGCLEPQGKVGTWCRLCGDAIEPAKQVFVRGIHLDAS